MSRQQQGVFLLEALMGILIFSLGILSLVAMQTAAVSAQSDAQYRIEAANLADEILGDIWLSLDRSQPVLTELPKVAHNASGAITGCSYSGTAAQAPYNTLVTNWANRVTGAGGLPGATASMLQIAVNAGAGFNKVTVTLCWQSPVDASPHRHSVVSFING